MLSTPLQYITLTHASIPVKDGSSNGCRNRRKHIEASYVTWSGYIIIERHIIQSVLSSYIVEIQYGS